MASEPLKPPIRHAIQPHLYYCLHCGNEGTLLRERCAEHVKAFHDVDFVAFGVDYVDGTSYIRMVAIWQVWEDQVTANFAKHLDSLRGADDFVLEAEAGS